MTDLSTVLQSGCGFVAQFPSSVPDTVSLQREISIALFGDADEWAANDIPDLHPVATGSTLETGDRLWQLLEPNDVASFAILIPHSANSLEATLNHGWVVLPKTVSDDLRDNIIKKLCEKPTLLLWSGNSQPQVDMLLDATARIEPDDPLGLLALGVELVESNAIPYDAFLDLAHLVGHCGPAMGDEGSGCIGGLSCPPKEK